MNYPTKLKMLYLEVVESNVRYVKSKVQAMFDQADENVFSDSINSVMNEKETESEEVIEKDLWEKSEVSSVNEKESEEPTTEESEDVGTIDETPKAQ